MVLLLYTVPGDSPQGFQSTATTSTSITLTWLPPSMPNGVITGYTLTLDNESFPLPESRRILVASNLSEATTFTFTLSAETRVGPGPADVLTESTREDSEKMHNSITMRS